MDPEMSEDSDSFGPPGELNTGARSLQHPMSQQDMAYNPSAQEMTIPLQDPAYRDQVPGNHAQQQLRPTFSPRPHQLFAADHEQQHFNPAVHLQQQQHYVYLNHEQQAPTQLVCDRPTGMPTRLMSPRQNTAIPGYLAHTEASRARVIAALNQPKINQLPRNYHHAITPALQSTKPPRQYHLLQEVSPSPLMSHPRRAGSQASSTPQPRRNAAQNLDPKKKMDTDKQSAAMTVQEEGQASESGPSAANTSSMTELTRTITEGPATMVVAHQTLPKMPGTTAVGIAMQQPLFSVALSPAGPGYFGGLQFWDGVDEYLRHVQTISNLHDVCKRFAAWVVNHDMQTSGLGYHAYITQIDSIMQNLFHMECTARYGNYEAFFNAPGKTMLQPESILLQLDAEVKLCLMGDLGNIRGLNPPNQASVRQLKQDSTRNHIHFYRTKTQLLGLILSSIMNGRRNDLIVRATQQPYRNIANLLLGETERALEANHRGTASLQQRFYYQDEFKNAIAWGLGDSATRNCEGTADEGIWLHTFADHAIRYRALLAEPKLPEGGILPVPALLEMALYHVDQITYHAHDEMTRYNQAIRPQGPRFGKRNRSPDENQALEIDNDKDVVTPSKKSKTTKESSQTKLLYGFTKQSAPAAGSWDGEDGDQGNDTQAAASNSLQPINGDWTGEGDEMPAGGADWDKFVNYDFDPLSRGPFDAD